jgi:hypothetical protein
MLRELQLDFRAAMLDGDDEAAARRVCDDGIAAGPRLAIYRHHVFTSLTAALESTYPVVVRLVDPRFFRFAADRYTRTHPPSSPCLFEYGATLGEFLAGFAPSQPLAYLPDVARLEWAMNVALHAPDAAPIERVALSRSPRIALHPSVTLLQSPWPIDAIWRANQAGVTHDRVDLNAGGVRLQVWRSGDEVVFRPLLPTEFVLRDAIMRTGSLEAAAGQALTVDAGTDLAAHIGELLAEEVLIERS